jgi:tetratricopeptide (TPR) repeat protein
MIMLDKARASVWIKVGAIVIVLAFVLAYIPSLNMGALGDLFNSIFQSSGTTATDTQNQARIIQLKEKISTKPKSVTAKDYFELANLYYDSQKYPNATTYYEKGLKVEPKNYDAMTDLGASYYAQKQNDKALAIFLQVTQEKPDQAMAWFNLGIVYQAKNDTPDMKYAWERYLAIQPTGNLADQVRSQLSKTNTATTTQTQQ